MNRITNQKDNEQGSVLVIALTILVLLTLMGISVTRTSDIDIQIAKNEQEFVKEFYVADSAWKQGIQWLDTLAAKPNLVNSALFLADETSNDNYLNVRNYGGGASGVYNDNFTDGTQDGILGTGDNQLNYWYKVAYKDTSAMNGEKAPLFGDGFRRYFFTITGHAGGAQGQVVQVTVSRVMESGAY